MSKDRPQRPLLGKQPARLLMVDLTAPFGTDVIEDVCDVLENLYAVACNFSGPSRIPFFSIVMLHDYQKPILPFSYIKNNFSRIQTAISDMRGLMQESCHTGRECIQFDVALQEVYSQFKRQLQPTFQSDGFSISLEIVILSNQNDKIIQRQVENATMAMKLDQIKKIQVVCLMNLDVSLEDEPETSQNSEASLTSHQSSDSVTGLVDLVKLDPDILYLQNFFNHWLLDTNTDTEHLHLILPAAGDLGSSLVIKCDLHERLLHPAQLPFYHNFTLHSDASAMKIVFPSNSKAMGMTVPIYKLRVTGQVPLSTVCDSLVYDMPMIVRATSCWRIDWDDLEKHQQNFKALCSTLARKEHALLAHLLPQESTTSTSSKPRQNRQKPNNPTGNFLLLPSSHGSLLVKCLAVQELILPYTPVCDDQDVPEEHISLMNDILDEVEVFPNYNPLNHPSNLYECLKSMTNKSTAQRSQKRQSETSVSCTNKLVTTSGKQPHKLSTHQGNADETDTPLSKRQNKVPSTHTRRRLYNQNNHFMGDNTDFVDLCGQDWGNLQQNNQSFPTSL